MNIKVQKATEKDLDMIHQILIDRCHWFQKEKIEQWDLNYPKRFNQQYFKDQMKENSVYIAIKEEETVGVMLIKEKDDSYWNNHRNAYYIRHFATKPNIHGVGKRMIEHAVLECKKHNKEYLRLECIWNNQKLNQYYQNLGFEFKGVVEGPFYQKNLLELKII